MKAYRGLLGCLSAALLYALPTSASAQCSGIFSAGEVCGNSTASGTLGDRASLTSMFDRAFCATNNSTAVRISGTWVCLASANNGVWVTSAAGVPSIGSTLPNAVQDNITRLGTIANIGAALGATFGGTGQSSYAVGDILFAPTTTTVGKLADVATGSAVISGGVGAAPSYGKIGLTTHVSGTLPIANGGTNAASASGTALDNITAFSSTGFLTRTGAGTYAFQNLSGGITLGNIATVASNAILANCTGSTANVTAVTPSINGQTFRTSGGVCGWGALDVANSAAVTGQLPLANIASISADFLLGNFTGSTAAPGSGAIGNCANALTYSTSTHTFGCNVVAGTGTVTNVATAGLATGGPITSTGTVTVTSATKSDQQTGTSTTTAVTPAQQQQHDSAVKVFARLSPTSSTCPVTFGYNVASCTFLSVGNYTVNFTTAFSSSTSFGCVVGLQVSNIGTQGFNVIIQSYTASSVTLLVTTVSITASTPDGVTVSCNGRQ